MKKSLMTIGFMVLITILFISALASINELSKDQIVLNLEIERYKSVLYAFNIFPKGLDESQLSLSSTTDNIPWEPDQIRKNYESQIISKKIPLSQKEAALLKNSFLTWKDSVEIFIRLNESNEPIAYGFPMKGKGLWGTITAFGVISADLTKMVGIDFTEQVETPGLGARILEKEFKQYFRNLDLSGFQENADTGPAIIMVRKKDATNLDESTNSLQAITGATLTCSGVLNMMNTDMKFYINFIQNNQQALAEINLTMN